MKKAVLSIAIAMIIAGTLGSSRLLAQASDIPSAAPTATAGETPEQRGRKLLGEMVTALGGDAWLHRHDMQVKGRTAAFFQGTPTGMVIEYDAWRQFPDGSHPEAERIGFLTDKSMILPGKKIDVVQIWTADSGTEITYKGRIALPREQVEDYLRRRAHSIENVVNFWLKDQGSTMVERHLADKVTVLSPNNDAVTIELDANTHLPLRRIFEWRNTTFKDHDEDREEYDDYHTVQGLPTAFTLTRYHNGDMASQRFLSKVEYNVGLSPDLFNPDILLKKK
jgi:hypothetical protein